MSKTQVAFVREKTQSGGGGDVWWPLLLSPRHDPRGQTPEVEVEVEARANRVAAEDDALCSLFRLRQYEAGKVGIERVEMFVL